MCGGLDILIYTIWFHISVCGGLELSLGWLSLEKLSYGDGSG